MITYSYSTWKTVREFSFCFYGPFWIWSKKCLELSQKVTNLRSICRLGNVTHMYICTYVHNGTLFSKVWFLQKWWSTLNLPKVAVSQTVEQRGLDCIGRRGLAMPCHGCHLKPLGYSKHNKVQHWSLEGVDGPWRDRGVTEHRATEGPRHSLDPPTRGSKPAQPSPDTSWGIKIFPKMHNICLRLPKIYLKVSKFM